MYRRHWLAAAFSPLAALAATAALASPALACGGLVGENGTIRLERTTTLAAYHGGVEHYVTAFTFTGEGEELGAIIPLPGVPTKVERAGDWTLQRLAREVAPPERATFAAAAAAEDSAEVLLETKIDALELTVLSGGGDEVGRWALDHGFLLTPDAPDVLDFYAQRSPIFLAARFDAATAKALNQTTGDGTPIHLEIPTEDPWVPLRILSLGLKPEDQVLADVFLLTDDRPLLLVGAGTGVERSVPASAFLLDDLRNDANSAWIPESAWFTHVEIDAEAGQLDYDLAVGTQGRTPSTVDAGLLLTGAPLQAVRAGERPSPFSPVDVAGGRGGRNPVAVWGLGGAALAGGLWFLHRDLAARRARAVAGDRPGR